MTILVIEDSRLLRSAISRILVKAGFQVTAVGDGREGLTCAEATHPDIILLDMMLPTMEGTAVLRQLKTNLVTKQIPVVVLSGLSQKNDRRLLADGASGYIEKSALDFDGDGSTLLAVLQPLLGGGTSVVESMTAAPRYEARA
jgi:CheY-like chemotaxis protein